MKSGFTIIEILVALLSVTLISLFSYQYLSNTSLVKDRLEKFISEDTKKNNTFPKFIIVEYSINDEIYKYTLSTFK